MKTFSISLILIVFLPICIYSQALEELEKEMVAKNRIATRARIDFKYSGGKPSKKGIKTSITTYNRRGDLIKVEYLNEKGAVTGTEHYEYDRNGNRTLYERKGTSKYKKITEYNSNNQIVSESGFNGSENFMNTYSYQSNGKLSEITYTTGGTIQQKLKYEHSGNTAHVGIYAGGVSLTSKLIIKYNPQDHIVEETTLSIDNAELEKKNYSYTSRGQILEETKTVKDVLHYRLSYAYNSSGNLLSVSEENRSEKKFVKKDYGYDASGNLISYKWRRKPSEEFNVKTYTYNQAGVCLTEHTFYPNTRFELLSKYEYSYY